MKLSVKLDHVAENALGRKAGFFIAAAGDVVSADDAQADPVVTPAQADQMTQDKADEELSKLGPKSSLDVTLRDWDSWSYRRPYEVGDRVSVDVNGLTVTDRIESVRLTVSASNGVQVVSSIGGWEDDATYELARALRATQAELRRLGSQT